MKQSNSILFLARLYHPHIGGVEKHVEFISHALIKKGFDITILTEKYENNLKEEEEIDGVRVIRIPIGKSLWFKKFWIWKWMILNANALKNYKIIHVHDVFFWLLPIFPIIFFKKIYVTFHGYEGFPIRKTWILQRKVYEKLSSGTICVGDFMRKWYFASPTYVIYGGVRQEYKKFKEKKLSAVFFGRFDDQTGLLEYIKAYSLIKKQFPKFALTVVGDGPLKNIIPKDVKVLGFQDDVTKIISENRFIFVSRYLSMLEALVQKKEIIAVFDNSVKKDYLEMSPFNKVVHIAKNEAEIATFVINSIKNNKNFTMSDKGYKFAKKMSWENVCKIYLSLWGYNKR